MKGNKLIATFLPYPLQHDQHYYDIMFIFSATQTLMQIPTYILAKLNASYSKNPISILIYGLSVNQIPLNFLTNYPCGLLWAS